MNAVVGNFMSQVTHYGKTEHNNTQGIHTASPKFILNRYFKIDYCFKMCCSSSFEKVTLRIVDAVVSQGNLQQMKNTRSLFPFEISSCVTSSQLAETSGIHGTPIYCLERSGQKWSSWKSCNQKAIHETRPSKQGHGSITSLLLYPTYCTFRQNSKF